MKLGKIQTIHVKDVLSWILNSTVTLIHLAFLHIIFTQNLRDTSYIYVAILGIFSHDSDTLIEELSCWISV